MDTQSVLTSDGINWHVESVQNTAAVSSPGANKRHIILIPSGEGDCHNLAATAKIIAASAVPPTKVVTFDYPGYSRTTGPKEAYTNWKLELVAKQIITLLDKLEIKEAVFFGCSSGGCTVLALMTFYPERVRCAIVHEVPFETPPPLLAISQGTDEEIVKNCRELFDHFIEEENDGKRKYRALGEHYFGRLDKNFITWMRCMVGSAGASIKAIATPENLHKRPLFWTVGGLSPREFWEMDFEVAKAAGIEINTEVLNCNHFPTVTVPDDTAKWILQCVESVKSS